ncbi:class II fructose-bisphosphate aldolase [Chryseobacterium sp. WG23]|uniref:class II fructose-bisphosphate aldolase n=1 Tax=Chryseobacterium sp. WG23 TaxID=2926910 RepID=UPI00211DB966|nr:class II fructose-bisphosphate aldolase [Chryseobacterium sp. WG23]MCQ9637056.1 class II fructose-bisphosphate aldolase [Chryseobacterium sp. WG23]
MKTNSVTLFKEAYGKFCIPAINISMPEQIHALFSTAQKMNAPFIIQTTPVAREYMHPLMLINCVKAAAKIYPDALFALHLDHGNEPHIDSAIESGEYTSVMIDASHDPLEKNIERTKKISHRAHLKNISVEAELGVLSGVEDHLNIEEENALYTNPADVEYFVKEAGCDSLAVAVGTSHGAYKFSGGKGLRFDLLKDIQKRVPDFPVVLHGASSIDYEEIKRINAAGGNIKEDAKGITEEEIRKAIPYGICKLNIATDLRILWIRVLREYLQNHPDQLDPLRPGIQYMQELELLIAKKFEILGNTNKTQLYKKHI